MVTISLINKTEAKIYLEGPAINALLSKAAECLKLTGETEIEILYVGQAEIQNLNKKYRGIDQPTDVLSFPQAKIPGKSNLLGSLILSEEVVAEKGEEMESVIKHGFLHLLGFDHEKDEKAWQKAAKKIDCKL